MVRNSSLWQGFWWFSFVYIKFYCDSFQFTKPLNSDLCLAIMLSSAASFVETLLMCKAINPKS